jgi:hypothetical protein
VATLFGCALGLSNMVTAITFVALGRAVQVDPMKPIESAWN